ncbi:lipid phosphate phosphatase 1 [Phtheirospermum japonicum]|uniref:Lipid phosphate phosphatase 1 n=1 Tax=Phtheirospermum japonicum TaxID=374723 RepID=A0A830B3X2_9LAMI|nr:lipid phosphate phosphatase 1 [Phtheirospermum japonicum]
MTDLKYPMKENTVPVWAVPIYAVLLPIAIFVFFYLRRRDVYDLHHAILGLLFAALITAVLTDSIKNATGRPRPDFFWRCFPDGVEDYNHLGDVRCHGSFAGLGYLALYLSGKIKCFDGRGHVSKLCILFFPILAACLVGISRVDDYWHHWQDVFAGGLLGWGTYAYFRALEETRSLPVQSTNGINMQGMNHRQSSDPNLDTSFDSVEIGRR